MKTVVVTYNRVLGWDEDTGEPLEYATETFKNVSNVRLQTDFVGLDFFEVAELPMDVEEGAEAPPITIAKQYFINNREVQTFTIDHANNEAGVYSLLSV